MSDLAAAGVDFDDVTATLEREGVDSFAASYTDALATLEKRRARGHRPDLASSPHAAGASVGAVGEGGAEVVGERRRVTCALSPLVLGIT